MPNNAGKVKKLFAGKEKKVSVRDGDSSGRGRRIRTLNKGFGDPRVTITPCPSDGDIDDYTGQKYVCQAVFTGRISASDHTS